MARDFRLPDLGSGLKEGLILRWNVAVGDTVTSDGVLCELETEKAVIEVPIPFDGVVQALAVEEDDTIEVGEILVTIETGGSKPEAAAESETVPVPVAVAVQDEDTSTTSSPSPSASSPTPRVRAMPSIRRLARQNGIDLAAIHGTGKHGRITRADLEAVATGAPAEEPATTPSATDRREKLSMLRKSIAEHMTRSWREIPHVFTRLEVDAGPLLDARAILADRFEKKIPIEALLIKAVIPVLDEFPQFNASVEGDEIVYLGHRDIAVAVDTADGLIVPVIKGADQAPFTELVDRLADLFARTAARKATPEELSGATFTINNIGAGGHLMGTSIIPHGTTAILSAGRAEKMAVVRDDEIVIRSMMEISLCFDHRAIDGGHAQRFMARVRQNIEQPVRFLAV